MVVFDGEQRERERDEAKALFNGGRYMFKTFIFNISSVGRCFWKQTIALYS